MKRLSLIPALLLLAGCPSFSTMGTARTLPKGSTQFWVAPEVVTVRDFGVNTGSPKSSASLVQVEAGVRYGITDSVELDAKAWELGLSLGAKFQLFRSGSPDSGIDIAIDPAVAYLSYADTDGNSGSNNTSAGTATFYLPVLLGVNVGGGSQIVLAPKVVDQVFFASGSSTYPNLLWAGGSLGFAWKLSDSFRLMPEVSAVYPVSFTHGTADLTFKGVMIQSGLGLLFGGGP